MKKILEHYRIQTFVDSDFIYNTVLTYTRMLAMGIVTANEYEKMCVAFGIRVELVKIE